MARNELSGKASDEVVHELYMDCVTGINAINSSTIKGWMDESYGRDIKTGSDYKAFRRFLASNLWHKFIDSERQSAHHPMQKYDPKRFVNNMPVAYSVMEDYIERVLNVKVKHETTFEILH